MIRLGNRPWIEEDEQTPIGLADKDDKEEDEEDKEDDDDLDEDDDIDDEDDDFDDDDDFRRRRPRR